MDDLLSTLQGTILEAVANLHTATVAKVVAVNDTTIDCQPVVARDVGGVKVVLPVFSQVPPVFMQGGGSYTAHPIVVGDYALLIFSERCFDSWYSGQDFEKPLEYRMHDYSDGFAIVGINPLASAITIPSVIQRTGDTNQDGDITHQGNRAQTGDVTHVGDKDQTGDITHTGNKTQTGVFALTGNMTIAGDGGPGTANMTNITINITTGDIIADGISLINHVHGGVQAGTSTTGAPQ
jgi:hypothetical protein